MTDKTLTLADFTAIELLVREVEAQNYIYEQVALDGIARRHGYADFEDYNFARDELIWSDHGYQAMIYLQD
jgi:hypothetical protein